jgi:hypothetical protein
MKGGMIGTFIAPPVASHGMTEANSSSTTERSLTYGGRLVSIYRSVAGVKFNIITESDQSRTTVLLPEDY